MNPVLVSIAVVAVVAALVVLLRRRRPVSRLDGVEGFRRHMDALSSEARRDVIDRVREARREPEED